MNWLSRWRRVAIPIVTLTLLFLLAGLPAPTVVLAQGGLALSGSFHNQDFVIPQSASVGGPSIDVVVFNNGGELTSIRMLSQSPPGVTISFSNQEFTIPAGGQQQVLIGVAIAADVAPGDYELRVTPQSYKKGGTGLQIAGAAGQTARLTVTGESAQVALRALSPDGQPVKATVRLYRLSSGQNQEVAYSETGNLQVTAAPGDFKAASYIGGQQVAEQSFTLASGDNKTIELTGATVYFASFGVLPAYANDSGKLAFVQIVYTVKNIYQQVDQGDVILQVSFNGMPLAPLTLVTLSPLIVGSSGLNYNYNLPGVWEDGKYDFKLELNLNGKLYTSSTAQSLIVSGVAATPSETTSAATGSSNTQTITNSPTVTNSGSTTSGEKGMSPYVIGGIVAAVVVILAVILVIRSRRK
jgi:hypothetical protein